MEMEAYPLNTKEYWNNRFETNWEARAGREQTRFFSELVCSLLPEWLAQDIQQNAYDFLDVGCAQGDALDSFHARFGGSRFYGEDFSPTAIEKAKASHSGYTFETADIRDSAPKKQYDIVYCSNVLEHFEDPREVLARVIDRAIHYAIVLIPFREEAKFHEHVVTFDMDSIPLFQSGAALVYARAANCQSKYYHGEQALFIYAKNPQARQLACLKDIAGEIGRE